MRAAAWMVMALVSLGCEVGPQPQVLHGRIGLGWETAPVEVRAHSGRFVARAPIAEDGTFVLELRGERYYTFDVLRANGTTVELVFPESDGTAPERLRVYGGARDFDMGAINRFTPFDSTVYVRQVLRAGASPTEVGRASMALTIAPDGEMMSAASDGGGGDAGDGDGDGDSDPAEVCDDDFDDDSDSDSDDDDEEEDERGGRSALRSSEAAVPERVPPQGIGVCHDDCDSDSDSDDSDEDDEDGEDDEDDEDGEDGDD